MIKAKNGFIEIEGTGSDIIKDLTGIYKALESGNLFTEKEKIVISKLTEKAIVSNILKESED